MTREAMDAAVRETILADPEALLEDAGVMRALVAAGGRAMGPNVVDMRGMAMDRLEARLGRLEDTHRSVIAAAYDNLSGTQQVHRAVLRLLEAGTLAELVAELEGEVAAILRVDGARLIVEGAMARPERTRDGMGDGTRDGTGGATAEGTPGTPAVEAPGFVDAYLARGRAVVLRTVPPGAARTHGEVLGGDIRSEACLRLDLGPGRRPAMLALGSFDPRHFAPSQATDLLQFLGGVVERVLRRWL